MWRGDGMEEYMAALINGSTDDDGEIVYLGYQFNYSYHAECLKEYATWKYPQISGLDKMNYMAEPLLPIYYLTLLNNIIFTNISVDDERRGMLYFPRNISMKQYEKIWEFLDEVADFQIIGVYNMALLDDMVVGSVKDDFQKGDIKKLCKTKKA